MKKILVYWRDIPSQVLVQKGRVREKALLSKRFQEAIDRAAMRAGKGGSDAYIAEWRRESSLVPAGSDMQQILTKEVSRLEAAYDDERFLTLIRAHGVDQAIRAASSLNDESRTDGMDA